MATTKTLSVTVTVTTAALVKLLSMKGVEVTSIGGKTIAGTTTDAVEKPAFDTSKAFKADSEDALKVKNALDPLRGKGMMERVMTTYGFDAKSSAHRAGISALLYAESAYRKNGAMYLSDNAKVAFDQLLGYLKPKAVLVKKSA